MLVYTQDYSATRENSNVQHVKFLMLYQSRNQTFSRSGLRTDSRSRPRDAEIKLRLWGSMASSWVLPLQVGCSEQMLHCLHQTAAREAKETLQQDLKPEGLGQRLAQEKLQLHAREWGGGLTSKVRQGHGNRKCFKLPLHKVRKHFCKIFLHTWISSKPYQQKSSWVICL
jgi:hypothetical protein